MNATADPMDICRGFPVEGDVPRPSTGVDVAVRERLVAVVAAITRGRTPEDIAGFLRDGFPPMVDEVLEDVLEWAEMNAYVDLLLVAQA